MPAVNLQLSLSKMCNPYLLIKDMYEKKQNGKSLGNRLGKSGGGEGRKEGEERFTECGEERILGKGLGGIRIRELV